MAFTPVNDGDLAVAPQVQQIIDALSGVTGAGQPISLTSLDEDALHALTLKNLGTGGLALHVNSSSGGDLLDVRDAYTDVDNGTLRVDHATNRVGVNKTSPTVALDVTGGITASGAISGATLAISGAASLGSIGATAFTGRVGVPVGTAGAPGLYFDTVSDEAGVNSTDGSNVSLTTGGAARLTVTDGATTVANALTLSSASLGYVDLPAISAPSAPASGDRVYTRNSGSHLFIRSAAGSEREIADLSTSQVLSSKTLTSPTVNTSLTMGSSSQILAPTSSDATTPEYSFSADPNTGMYSSAADTLNFATAGSNRLSIDSAGLVAVGGSATVGGTMQVGVAAAAGGTAVLTGTAGGIRCMDRTTPYTAYFEHYTTSGTFGIYNSATASNALTINAAGVVSFTNGALTTPTLTNPNISTLTTAGDLLYGTGSGAIAARALGTKGYALLADTSSPKYEQIARKNFLLNGSFQVSQRYAYNTGVSVTDNTFITADRWKMLYDTSSNAPSTYNSTSFFTLTAGASRTSLTFQAANAATGRHGMFQVIGSAYSSLLRGKAVSLSFTAFAQSSFSDIRAAIVYWTGTADDATVANDPVTTWSSLVSGTPGNASGLSGSWLFANTPANLSISAGWTVCKIENISIPQAATHVGVLVWCDDTSTTFGEFWGVNNIQLEIGSICTAFEPVDYEVDLIRCGAAGTAGLLHSSSTGVPSYLSLGTKGYALLAGASAPQYDPIDRKNRLINGSMRIFQRGTVDNNYTGTDNAYVGPDRWRTLTSGATPSVRQSSVWIPSSGASNRSWLALSGGNHRFGLFQVLEAADCWDLRGQSVSLQFQMTTPVGANISDVRAAVIYWVGTADDSNAVTGIPADPVATWSSLASGTPGNASGLANSWRFANTPANLNPTTSWAKYKIENVSISASATNVAVLIWAEDDTHTLNTDHLDVTDVQLEKGAVCTDFERIPYTQELLLCQRYYYKTFPPGVAPAQNTGNANGALAYVTQVAGTTAGNGAMLRYPVIMRTSPTVTFYNISAANTKWRNVGIGADSATPVTVAPNETGVFVTNAQVAGDLVSNQILVHLTADAEL